MAPHVWIHVVRHGPAGIAALIVYLATAPLMTVSGFSGGRFSSHKETVFGSTPWSQGGATFAAIVVFVVIAAAMHFVTHEPGEGSV